MSLWNMLSNQSDRLTDSYNILANLDLQKYARCTNLNLIKECRAHMEDKCTLSKIFV